MGVATAWLDTFLKTLATLVACAQKINDVNMQFKCTRVHTISYSSVV